MEAALGATSSSCKTMPRLSRKDQRRHASSALHQHRRRRRRQQQQHRSLLPSKHSAGQRRLVQRAMNCGGQLGRSSQKLLEAWLVSCFHRLEHCGYSWFALHPTEQAGQKGRRASSARCLCRCQALQATKYQEPAGNQI